MVNYIGFLVIRNAITFLSLFITLFTIVIVVIAGYVITTYILTFVICFLLYRVFLLIDHQLFMTWMNADTQTYIDLEKKTRKGRRARIAKAKRESVQKNVSVEL